MDSIEQLREAVGRRGLTAAETAAVERHLAAHPEEREAWLEERALNRVLRRLPDAPLAGNFTARVMQAIDRDPARSARGHADGWFALRRWLPRLSAATLVVALSGGGLIWHRQARRTDLASALSEVSLEMRGSLTRIGIPPIEVLKDYEAIQRLGQQSILADEELLEALR